MAPSCVVITSAAELDAELARSQQPGELATVLVDFWAPWCGPCKAFAPALEEIASKNADKVVVLKVDCDEVPDLATRFQISNLPTFIAFIRGQRFGSVEGANKIKVLGLLDQALGAFATSVGKPQ